MMAIAANVNISPSMLLYWQKAILTQPDVVSQFCALQSTGLVNSLVDTASSFGS